MINSLHLFAGLNRRRIQKQKRQGCMSKGNNTTQAFWVAMGSLSSFSLAILSAAILSRYFEKTEYGTYKQIVYVYSTMLIVFSAGLPNVFSYFLPRYEREEGKEIVNQLTKVLLALGFCFSLVLFLGSEFIAKILNNPELGRGLRYFSIIPVFLLPTLGIEGIFSTYKQTIFIAIYNTITRTLMLFFIVVPVIVFKGSYLMAIYGWIIVSVISFVIALYFKQIPFKGVEKKISGLSVKEIFAYSVPIMLASIGGIIMRSSDQFYISRFFGTDSFAEYSNGFIQLPFVGMITGAASTILMPLFSKIVSDKSDLKELVTIWRSTLVKSATTIYPILIFFIINAEPIIGLLYSNLYVESILYFQIAMGVNFFNIIIFTPLILAFGKTKFYANIHFLFAGLTWLFGYLAMIIFGSPYMIALSSVLINILLVLSVLVYSSNLIKVKLMDLVPLKEIVLLILHALFSFFIAKYIMDRLPLNLKILHLIGSGAIGAVILLSSATFLNLDYFSIIRPLIDKIKIKFV